MVTASNRIMQSFAESKADLWNGDLLLFRGRGLIARWIGTYGRGSYSHAAMVGWWHDHPMCMELREFHGGQAVTLSSQVAKYPETIDVYRPNVLHRQREGAMAEMRRKCGSAYSYSGIWAAALLHLPFVRLWKQVDTSDEPGLEAAGLPEFCSQAVASAYQVGGGFDAVPNLHNRLTEPNDLARSSRFTYLFTLTP